MFAKLNFIALFLANSLEWCNRISTRKKLVLLTIFIIAIFLGADWLVLHGELTKKALSNSHEFIRLMFMGTVSSLIACIVWVFINDRPVWGNDMESAKGLLSTINDNTANFSHEFPKAFGPNSFSGIMRACPLTSKAISEVLGTEMHNLYLQHFRRIAVMEASDEYTLLGMRQNVPCGHVIYAELWDVDFSIGWEWRNDCALPVFPFQDFSILITADESENYGANSIIAKQDRDALRESLSQRNCVRSIVANPSDRKALLSGEQVNTLFSNPVLRYRRSGRTDCVASLTVSQSRNMYVYYSLHVDSETSKFKLDRGDSVSVTYSGKLLLPVLRGTDTSRIGFIISPFSDIIVEHYEFIIVLCDGVELDMGGEWGLWENYIVSSGMGSFSPSNREYKLTVDRTLYPEKTVVKVQWILSSSSSVNRNST